MAEYVQFRAKGVIYNRDKDGKPTTVREIRRGSGVVKTGPEIMGKVFVSAWTCFRVIRYLLRHIIFKEETSKWQELRNWTLLV